MKTLQREAPSDASALAAFVGQGDLHPGNREPGDYNPATQRPQSVPAATERGGAIEIRQWAQATLVRGKHV